jgi:hypothetical protein
LVLLGVAKNFVEVDSCAMQNVLVVGFEKDAPGRLLVL